MNRNDGKMNDFVKAYSDTSLYKSALKKVKLNQKARNLMGEIKEIDNLAVIEGTIK